MKVAIINYGVGNLGSVRRAFEDLGAEPVIANHPSALYDVNRIVLPGVGAFQDGMAHLDRGGWTEVLKEVVGGQGKPLLGICLGMQLLASEGHENGITPGLGMIPGQVRRLDELGCTLRIPHVGWNEACQVNDDVLFSGIPNASDFYFVHSYAFVPDQPEHLLATVPYGVDLTAAVRREHIFGCQFHPEKSSKAGRLVLSNFLSYSPC
ncbi:imidazole glycerol phosphate synthase subunit HisH [Pseudomonas putida]|uniref:imidazole glycerol phosphate synthase subunit HisH n=1 Tax=Pseudomonas TaxID=286 RepID=UPI003466FFC8